MADESKIKEAAAFYESQMNGGDCYRPTTGREPSISYMLAAFARQECDRETADLRKQLPEGMEHCTILFKECELGHGWLTATNWIQHGCPTCETADLRDRLETERRRIFIEIYSIYQREVDTYKFANVIEEWFCQEFADEIKAAMPTTEESLQILTSRIQESKQ